MGEKKDLKLMESLPDEIWLKIFEIGINNSTVLLKDLFNLSMSSKHFYHLSNDNIPWSAILTLKYPKYAAKYSSSSSSISSCSSVKSLCQYTMRLSNNEAFGRICKLLVDIMDIDPVLYYQNLKMVDKEMEVAFAELEDDLSLYRVLWTCDPIDNSLAPDDILVHFTKKRDELLRSQQAFLAAQHNLQGKIDFLLGRPLEW